MSTKSNNFIQIPRSLLEHPTVKAAPFPQKWLLITIIQHACFLPCQIDDHQTIIDLQPGQLCCSFRQLADWSGSDKNNIERGIARFSKVQILRHEVRHKKSIITITHTDTYDLIKQYSETGNETKVRQERDKSETQKDKEDNDDKERRTKKIQKEKIKIREWVSLSQDEIDKHFHEFSDKTANEMLDTLDAYNESRQKHYISDEGALQHGGWVSKAVEKHNAPKTPYNAKSVDRRTCDINGVPVENQYAGRF